MPKKVKGYVCKHGCRYFSIHFAECAAHEATCNYRGMPIVINPDMLPNEVRLVSHDKQDRVLDSVTYIEGEKGWKEKQ